MAKASGGDKLNKPVIGIVPEELTENNYEDWKMCLKHYLVGHGLWGVVSGKEAEPSRDKKQKHEGWKKKNALALHAIQLSCGAGRYAKFKDAHTSAQIAWNHLAEKIKSSKYLTKQDHEDENHAEDEGSKDYLNHTELYRTINQGNLNRTKSLLEQNPNAVEARISSHKDTALHIAILAGHMKIAEELVKKMKPEDLEMTNEYGYTALSLAAISGATKLAKILVARNHKLVSIKGEQEDGELPVIVAARYGKKRIVRYLFRVTPKEELSPERDESGVTLLNSLITAEIYDVASMLLKRFPKLGIIPDHNGDYTLRILSHKPSAFPSGTTFVFWKKWIYSCVVVNSFRSRSEGTYENESITTQHSSIPEDHSIDIHDSSDDNMAKTMHGGARFTRSVQTTLKELGWRLLRCLVPDIKDIHDRKLIHTQAKALLTGIFKQVRKLNKSELEKMGINQILYDAIEHGIIEFVDEILNVTPELIWRKDKRGRTLFAHAIILRQEKIYSRIHALGAEKSIIAHGHDVFGNNFLHLAAKMSPQSQLEKVSGAALQMQRELQWFQEVETIVQPKCKEEKNENMKTPSTHFSDEHKLLAKEGERWMKNTAGSSMIVGTLIAAVMFTTAFTVPGGNDNYTGLPILLKKQRKAFLLFMGSNALAMFTSSTSILMFLGILTARYAERDFLKSLPTKLIFGIACLFISIVTMMVSFGAAIYLMLIKELAWVSYPIIVFSIIPVALFSVLQFPLLIEMINRTYGSGIFKKHKRKLLSELVVDSFRRSMR